MYSPILYDTGKELLASVDAEFKEDIWRRMLSENRGRWSY